MARLPQEGELNWGGVLNDYLSQSLANDGTLKPGVVNENNLDPNLQAKMSAAASDTASDSSLQTIYHNDNQNVIRPATSSPVVWVGTVRPSNWLNGDIWFTASPTTTPPPTEPPTDPPTEPPATGFPTGLVAHYSVLDLASLANGATVSNWPNKISGGASLTNASGTPSYNATNKYVQYDGVDDRHDGVVNVPQPSTTIVVGRYLTAGASKPFVSGTSTVNGITATGASAWSMNAGTSLAHGSRIDTNWHFIEARFNGTNSSLLVDSTRVSGNAGTAARTGIRIASNTGLSSYSNIAVKAVLVFNKVLTADEVEAVRSKLSTDLSMAL